MKSLRRKLKTISERRKDIQSCIYNQMFDIKIQVIQPSIWVVSVTCATNRHCPLFSNLVFPGHEKNFQIVKTTRAFNLSIFCLWWVVSFRILYDWGYFHLLFHFFEASFGMPNYIFCTSILAIPAWIPAFARVFGSQMVLPAKNFWHHEVFFPIEKCGWPQMSNETSDMIQRR